MGEWQHCIETAGLRGKTRHLFTAGESKKANDETCLLNALKLEQVCDEAR